MLAKMSQCLELCCCKTYQVENLAGRDLLWCCFPNAQSTKRRCKQVSNLRLQRGPGTGSFRPIGSSNRFKRLASVAMTVRLLAPCIVRVHLPKNQETSGVSPTFLVTIRDDVIHVRCSDSGCVEVSQTQKAQKRDFSFA